MFMNYPNFLMIITEGWRGENHSAGNMHTRSY